MEFTQAGWYGMDNALSHLRIVVPKYLGRYLSMLLSKYGGDLDVASAPWEPPVPSPQSAVPRIQDPGS